MSGDETPGVRPMTRDDALALLAGDVGQCREWCQICGIPTYWWWTEAQIGAHRRWHQALAVAAAGAS